MDYTPAKMEILTLTSESMMLSGWGIDDCSWEGGGFVSCDDDCEFEGGK